MDEFAQPQQLHSSNDIEAVTGIARRAASDLIRARFVHGYRHGSATYIDTDALTRLRALARYEGLPIEKALNVKVGPAEPREDGDGYRGWHADMTLKQVEASAGRWWNVACPEQLAADRAALVVTIGGVVVHVSQIVDHYRQRDGRSAFRVAPPSTAQHKAYASKILASVRGPLLQRLGYPS